MRNNGSRITHHALTRLITSMQYTAISGESKVKGWRIIGASVRGAAHLRVNAPNQDAIHWLPASGDRLPLILAMSDGHGSAKSFRSDVGAWLAVETAALVVHKLLGEPEVNDPVALQEKLPHSLVDTWRRAVQLHLQACPFTEAEWARLDAQENSSAREWLAANPLLAYGATLLLVAITSSYVLYAQ